MQAASKLRLLVLGSSPGNGHPYSWSAIFNGYDADAMTACPYPAIPKYLAEHPFPADYLADLGSVTHVWSQDSADAERIARASRVANVIDRPESAIGEIDAVLLARDDAENHLRLAAPFLEAGLPIYVDKPLAVSRAAAERLLRAQAWDGQIYSCTALRYAPELFVDRAMAERLGTPVAVDAYVPKGWSTYAVHVIEPVQLLLRDAWGLRPEVRSSTTLRGDGWTRVAIELAQGPALSFTATGTAGSPIAVRICGTKATTELVFRDSFGAFRAALRTFVEAARSRSLPIPREETLRVVDWIELGA